jgi:1-deoxy-D-xylulose-5-phosphate reductoisomerase
VDAFLKGRIRWVDIPDVCNAVLDRHDGADPSTVDDVIEADRRAREAARSAVSERTRA